MVYQSSFDILGTHSVFHKAHLRHSRYKLVHTLQYNITLLLDHDSCDSVCQHPYKFQANLNVMMKHHRSSHAHLEYFVVVFIE